MKRISLKLNRASNDMETKDTDEPVTPAGRLFLQPEMNQIINCAIGVKNPLDIDALKSEITNSVMLKQPRFNSLLITDSHGREQWRRTQVNVDRHFIVRHNPIISADDDSGPSNTTSQEDAVNGYLADLSVSSPLSTDKPLWEVHLLMAHNCLVMRLHHALGDGISLMSMFLTCCRKADDPTQTPTIGGVGTSSNSSVGMMQRRRRTVDWWWRRVVMVVWYTVVFVVEFVLRSLWLKDRRSCVSGGAGVELWPRKLATARFRLDDMKSVKRSVAEATINDVLFGVISCGLSRYLDIRSPSPSVVVQLFLMLLYHIGASANNPIFYSLLKVRNNVGGLFFPLALQDGIRMTGLAMVNLRPQPGLQDFSKLLDGKSGTRFGNQFGMLLLPVYYRNGGSDPLQFVRRAKSMIDKKKLSLEALFSYKIGYLVMNCFGAKLASLLNYRIVCNTTFAISNVVGPSEEITIIGNPVTYLRANTSSLPHAITMHMVSYAGRADMQILVAEDIIPDPQLLAKCFEDALLEMKDYAEAANTTRE